MRHAVVHEPATLGARAVMALLLKLSVIAVFLTAMLTLPAFPQTLGVRTFELSSFGRFTDFAPTTGLQSGVGAGLRLGYFVNPRWEVEGGIGFTRVDRMAGSETQERLSPPTGPDLQPAPWGERAAPEWRGRV